MLWKQESCKCFLDELLFNIYKTKPIKTDIISVFFYGLFNFILIEVIQFSPFGSNSIFIGCYVHRYAFQQVEVIFFAVWYERIIVNNLICLFVKFIELLFKSFFKIVYTVTKGRVSTFFRTYTNSISLNSLIWPDVWMF